MHIICIIEVGPTVLILLFVSLLILSGIQINKYDYFNQHQKRLHLKQDNEICLNFEYLYSGYCMLWSLSSLFESLSIQSTALSATGRLKTYKTEFSLNFFFKFFLQLFQTDFRPKVVVKQGLLQTLARGVPSRYDFYRTLEQIL